MIHHSLLELNRLIKETLSNNLDATYWVVAEIGELRVHQNGHCYMELVEKTNDKVSAKMRATIWSYTYRNLSTWFQGITGQQLRSGLKVLCNVSIQFHELYGLSLNVKDIDANFTLGERARKRQEVIDRLINDGIYELNRELDLPVVPQKVAIISSPTAAGYGDFIDQLESNPYGYGFNLKLFKATMQGDEAAKSIIDALLRINTSTHHYDLVVLIRGGGSQIDLDCFDNYDLTAHIAQFPLPVITGIGHERDETVADLVANTRVKTPTAVAEFLISGMLAFEERIGGYRSAIHKVALSKLRTAKDGLDHLSFQLKTGYKEHLRNDYHKFESFRNQLQSAVSARLSIQKAHLDHLDRTVSLLDPKSVLKRGFSFTTVNGKAIKPGALHPGDTILTRTLEMELKSEVKKIQLKNEE